MGAAKRQLEEANDARQIALGVLIDAGLLKECPLHDDAFIDTSDDITSAYKLANSLITLGRLILPSGYDRQAFSDEIKQAYEEEAWDSCARCDKIRDS